MLKVSASGSIQVVIHHLLDEVPETFERVVERYSKLDITLFHHIVSSPNCRYECRFGRGRVPDAVLAMNPMQRMESILKQGAIQGNPKGYFVNKHHASLTASQVDEIKSVSFSLCDSAGVPEHFDARKSEYGICFFHDFLEGAGIRPVVYLNDHDIHHQRQVIFNAPHLVEMCSPKYNMLWENEWRIRGRLAFTPDDVAFLIVPDSGYQSFMKWLTDEDLYNYAVLPSSVFNNHLDYLRILPNLDHSSWRQIRLFEGLLLDFDEFLEFTDDDRKRMLEATGKYLPCIAKADIQDLYEERYVSRYLRFFGQLNDETKNSPRFKKLANVDKNHREPWRSSKDLVKAAYEALFTIQQARITKDW
ncbi:MAG: hypothetical protein JWP89_1632 [Schlesneria sp.]|nr:hypothetical protein [Schlesneria sp.]